MASNKNTTNSDIFDRLDKLRVEIKGDMQVSYTSLKQDIQGLRSDFTTLEAGRLTAAEQKLNKLETNQGIANYKLYIMWFIITSATGIIVSVVATRLN